MPAEKNWSGDRGRPDSGDAVLRHPNGSIDIGAYAAIAHRQRAAAMRSSMLSAVRLIREAWAAVTSAVLTNRPLRDNPAADVEKQENAEGFSRRSCRKYKRSAGQHRRAIT
jgi:hypothetical protein